jgi:hypothetical protein
MPTSLDPRLIRPDALRVTEAVAIVDAPRLSHKMTDGLFPPGMRAETHLPQSANRTIEATGTRPQHEIHQPYSRDTDGTMMKSTRKRSTQPLSKKSQEFWS